MTPDRATGAGASSNHPRSSTCRRISGRPSGRQPHLRQPGSDGTPIKPSQLTQVITNQRLDRCLNIGSDGRFFDRHGFPSPGGRVQDGSENLRSLTRVPRPEPFGGTPADLVRTLRWLTRVHDVTPIASVDRFGESFRRRAATLSLYTPRSGIGHFIRLDEKPEGGITGAQGDLARNPRLANASTIKIRPGRPRISRRLLVAPP
jgi:hypothetical protein